MRLDLLKNEIKKQFDVCGIIETKTYIAASKKMNRVVPSGEYETMVVLGMAYPKRSIKHTKTHLVPSFYAFGKDYHAVLENRIKKVFDPLGIKYNFGVDNHEHDERLAATIAGIGYMGKNQLIINKDLGTYFFLAVVFLDIKIEKPFVLDVLEDCGDCRKCIDACPTGALSEMGYEASKCMSHYNQTKRVLTDFEIEKNYVLFGCDICQVVCPKNINKGLITHDEFALSGKEMISIIDLFTDSERVFKEKYKDMAYLWKGKTILMRNALTILYRTNNSAYNDLIEKSIEKYTMPWYNETAIKVLKKLKG